MSRQIASPFPTLPRYFSQNGKLSVRVKDLEAQLETAGEMRRASIMVVEEERNEVGEGRRFGRAPGLVSSAFR